MNLQPWMIPSDLAPGDAKSLARDWSDVELHRIESSDDPHFDTAFGALWSQFGAVRSSRRRSSPFGCSGIQRKSRTVAPCATA